MEIASSHHYVFAHQLLPDLFYKNPSGIINALKVNGVAMLRDIWDRLGENLDDADPLDGDGLRLDFRQADRDTEVALVTLPPPTGIPEAYFVAMVCRDRGNRLFFRRKPYARYITLEFGFHLPEMEQRTVLCEWEPGCRHLNMGDGPEPELSAFFREVCDMI